MKTTTITTIKRTLAPARLIIALALSTLAIASCQQAELPLNDADGTQAGQPLVVTIAPKQAFSSNDGADTRATTGTDGIFTWAANDVIYVKYTFDTKPTPTIVYHYWQNVGTGATTSSYFATGWNTYEGWTGTTAAPTMTWPVGAPTCKVQAFYTDDKVTISNDQSTGALLGLDLSHQTGATGDIMLFDKTFNVGEDIKVYMKHVTTRLTFKGLSASTGYTLQLNGAEAQRPNKFEAERFMLQNAILGTRTTNGAGTFTYCLSLDGVMDTQHRVAIEVIENSTSTAVTRAEIKATSVVDGTNTTYHIDGKMYTITPGNGTGSITPENNPDLMP